MRRTSSDSVPDDVLNRPVTMSSCEDFLYRSCSDFDEKYLKLFLLRKRRYGYSMEMFCLMLPIFLDHVNLLNYAQLSSKSC